MPYCFALRMMPGTTSLPFSVRQPPLSKVKLFHMRLTLAAKLARVNV